MNNLLKTFLLMCIAITGLVLLQLMPEMSLFGCKLRKVDLLSDIRCDSLLQKQNITINSQPVVVAAKKTNPDSLAKIRQSIKRDSTLAIEDFSNIGELHCSIDSFYQKLLDSKKLSRPVRIAYFGDSFIESDILTKDLRQYLQANFGGHGVGFVDVAHPLADIRSTVKSNSSNFRAHVATDKRGFCKDLSGVDLIYAVPTDTSAQFSLSAVKTVKDSNNYFNYSAVYYLTRPEVKFSAFANGKPITKMDAVKEKYVSMLAFTSPMKSVTWKMHFNSTNDTTSNFNLSDCAVFGASCESTKGVILDNFSLRGHSGLLFRRVPSSTMHDFLKLRHYDLVILGYGLNVASENRTNYNAYGAQLKKVVRRIAEVSPHTSILIVGVGDRARRTGAGIVTRPEILYLNQLQRKTAQSLGCAFWDLYNAMKKHGGIKGMTESKPPLANKDYTHINSAGGKKIARDLYNDIIKGLIDYKRRVKEFKKLLAEQNINDTTFAQLQQ